ncbi:salicylaldehyde dehydrogenase [Fusarium sp. NRRL 25303]|nr:salicylaldehyde dehydrogenase [Fusarium sp. NRRL 25303]
MPNNPIFTNIGETTTKTDVVPLIVDGNEIFPPDTFDVVNPTTGFVTHKGSDAQISHAKAALSAAERAFGTWSQTTPSHRRNIFLTAATIVEKRSSELVGYMMCETGSDEGWAHFNIQLAKECLVDCAGRIASIEGKIPHSSDPTTGALVIKEPYGVILAMAPWAVVWAIAAGNTVVFKGSELSPRSLWAVASVLQEAGLPNGVINFLTCSLQHAPDLAKTLISHPATKKINFTGSTAVGRIIAQLAGANLKPILLELGGKAPAIVCEDADLDVAAKHCALGAFMFAGQICMSTERILVHQSIRQEFEDKLKSWTSKLFSPDYDSPVLIDDRAVAKNRGLVSRALAQGASLVCGDMNVTESTNTRLRPIIIGNVKPGMEIYMTESFGPTVSVIEFEREENALAIANDTEYGLSSAIFSRDLRRALKLARGIETGAVHINRMTVHDESALPHGGAKSSGFGRFNAGMEEWVRTKNITYDL